MRMFVAAALTIVSTSSFAQDVDCKAVKDTTVPLQINWHVKNESRITQVYRDDSGNYVMWSTSSLGVTKATFVKGILTRTETTTNKSGKLKSVTNDVTIEGMPENFNRISNAEYKITNNVTYADDSTSESTAKVTYTFKSDGFEKVGTCNLFVVHGETDSINDASPDRTIHQPQVYFPELMFSLPFESAAVDGIQTTFTPLKPIE
jgi:hypothetical protein